MVNSTKPWRWWGRPTWAWIVTNRAWTRWYLIRYIRFLRLLVTCRGVKFHGPVFLGRNVRIESRPQGRIIIGAWVHLGDDTALRCHEGTLSIGDKCVFGQRVTIHCHLEVALGAECLIADDVYLGDFDHRTERIDQAIRKQGVVKTPILIGRDVWLGVKTSVLRGSIIGDGTVIGANSVVRGPIPDQSIAAGAPATVVGNRRDREKKGRRTRQAVATMAEEAHAAAQRAKIEQSATPKTPPKARPKKPGVTGP